MLLLQGALESATWCNKFVGLGGVKHLLNSIMSTDFQDPAKGSKRHICLALLLRVVNYFTIGTALFSSNQCQLQLLNLIASFIADITGKDGQEICRLRGDILLESVNADALVGRLLEITMRASLSESSDGKSDIFLSSVSRI